MHIQDFCELFHKNEALQNAVNAPIPKEAVGNREHPIWQHRAYDVYEKSNFNLYLFMKKMQRHSSLGDNLNKSDLIIDFYCFQHPEVQPTEKNEQMFSLYLNTAGERFEGPEVDSLMQAIFEECISFRTKTMQKKEARARIFEAFHVCDKNFPRWIQGGEWPMGQNSPMKFVGQQSKRR